MDKEHNQPLSTTSSLDELESLMDSLKPLLTTRRTIVDANSVSKFSKVMNTATSLECRRRILSIIDNTIDIAIKTAFTFSKGIQVLIVWIKEAKKNSDTHLILSILNTLTLLPFDIDSLVSSSIGKYVRLLVNDPSLEIQTQSKALKLRWSALLTPEESSINQKRKIDTISQDSALSDSSFSNSRAEINPTRITHLPTFKKILVPPPEREDSKVLSDEIMHSELKLESNKAKGQKRSVENTPPFLNYSSTIIDNKSQISNLQPQSSSSSSSSSMIDIPQNVAAVVKRTKHVTFKSNLCEIRLFTSFPGERSKGNSKSVLDADHNEGRFAYEHLMEDLESLIPWNTPKELDVSNFTPVLTTSKSKQTQRQREIEELAAFYYDETQIPDDPQEPDPYHYEKREDPLQIPLNDSDLAALLLNIPIINPGLVQNHNRETKHPAILLDSNNGNREQINQLAHQNQNHPNNHRYNQNQIHNYNQIQNLGRNQTHYHQNNQNKNMSHQNNQNKNVSHQNNQNKNMSHQNPPFLPNQPWNSGINMSMMPMMPMMPMLHQGINQMHNRNVNGNQQNVFSMNQNQNLNKGQQQLPLQQQQQLLLSLNQQQQNPPQQRLLQQQLLSLQQQQNPFQQQSLPQQQQQHQQQHNKSPLPQQYSNQTNNSQ